MILRCVRKTIGFRGIAQRPLPGESPSKQTHLQMTEHHHPSYACDTGRSDGRPHSLHDPSYTIPSG
jgi:hypothetical protein